MREKDRDDLSRAKEYCWKLFKFRLRSEKEIENRLRKRNFSLEVINEVISYLKSIGLIDDSLFAKSWIEARIQKSLGLKRIIHELENKGISEKIIQEEISKIKKNYSEYDIAKRLIEEKFKRKDLRIDPKAKRRIYSFLLRRGFCSDLILEVLSELLDTD